MLKICSKCNKLVSFKETCPCIIAAERKRGQEKNLEQDGFYTTKKWRKFRQIILKRDKEVCLRCLIKYNIVIQDGLEVHHIKPRSKYPELQYEETNCITLCKSCNTHLGTNEELDFEYEIKEVHNDFVL